MEIQFLNKVETPRPLTFRTFTWDIVHNENKLGFLQKIEYINSSKEDTYEIIANSKNSYAMMQFDGVFFNSLEESKKAIEKLIKKI